MHHLSSRRALVGILAFISPIFGPPTALNAATEKDKFYQAYYLENEGLDLERAAKLYAEAAEDRDLDKSIREQAQRGMLRCREAIAASDFARLLPANALAYVELKNPGARVNDLLSALGLLGDPNWLPEEGAKRVAVSPALAKELLGIRGAAIAVTGIDMAKQAPAGVLVFDPGNVDVIRGLIETALPAGGVATKPIGGYPTYNVEDEAFVTLTSRLVIVSNTTANIKEVIKKLSGKGGPSLADNKAITEMTGDSGDALIRFFVNAKELVPVAVAMAGMSGQAPQELQMAQALLDLDHLHSFSGRIDLGGQGFGVQIDLRLEEGHRNLVYNFLRAPSINHETLKAVPGGAAAFVIGAMNEATSRYGSAGGGDHPIVTALDLGREIFANITSLAFYVLPLNEQSQGSMVPNAGLTITVNDPTKSEALWTQMLGIASMASGSGGIEGQRVAIGGVEARTFAIKGGPTIHFAAIGNDVLVTSNASTMHRAVAARRDGDSILKDAGFESALARLTDSSVKGVFVHAGRCMEVARGFMSPGEFSEMAPFMEPLSRTTASLVVDHSDTLMRWSLQVQGIPRVGELVTAMLVQEQRQEQERQQLRHAMKNGKWDKALEMIDAKLTDHPNNSSLLEKKFDALALGKKDHGAAVACGKKLAKLHANNARALNNFAWKLLTEDKYGQEFDELARKMSQRSNELTEFNDWRFLDTLALAKFRTGDAEGAVELQRKAIEACKNDGNRRGLEDTLAQFEKSLEGETIAAGE